MMIEDVNEASQEPSRDVEHGNNTFEWTVAQHAVRSQGLGRKAHDRVILNNIAGSTRSGELTIILGPSGCGKTSLLDCLSLRIRSFEGALKLNGSPVTSRFFNSVGYIYQEELFCPELTALEHLQFHAINSLSHRMSMAAIDELIHQVIQEVKIMKCINTLIGGGQGGVSKGSGLSGGEKKRLAIATELLKQPPLLFLDEPTSGLDCVMSESIFRSLSAMASRGKMVITSVHCPSSLMYRTATHVLLLTNDGRLAYHGKTNQALSHFTSNLRFTLPSDCYPCDWFLELLTYTDDDADVGTDAARFNLMVKAFPTNPLQSESSHTSLTKGRTPISLWTVFRQNLNRVRLQATRDLFIFFAHLAVDIIVGGALGVLYYQQADRSWRNLNGLCFTMAVAALMIVCVGTTIRLSKEWPCFMREYMSNSNALLPYYIARSLGDYVFLPSDLVGCTITYWLTGMSRSFPDYLVFLGMYALLVRTAKSCAFLTTSFSPSPIICLMLMPGLLMPMIMFSGLLYQRGTCPPWLAWLEKLSPVNYGFSALVMQQSKILPDFSQRMLFSFLGLEDTDLGSTVAMLPVLIIGFHCLAILNLYVRLSRTTT